MEGRPPLSWGSIQRTFFVYDHCRHREEDDPKDAVLYFYPPSVNVEKQIALVGGLIGMVNFCSEVLEQGVPSLVSLTSCKFAVLKSGMFVLGLSADLYTPQDFVIEHLQFLWDTFCLFQGSFEAVKQKAENFVAKLNKIFNSYFSFCESYGDPLSQAFCVIPYKELPKSECTLFLKASHILEQAEQRPGVLGGVLFNKNKVLCTQLSNTLTRRLLILMPQQQHFPCNEIKPEFELPGGVRLLCVFLTTEELITLSPRRHQHAHAAPRNASTVQTVSGAGESDSGRNASYTLPVASTSVSVDLSDVFCDSISDLPVEESGFTASQSDSVDQRNCLQISHKECGGDSKSFQEESGADSQRSDSSHARHSQSSVQADCLQSSDNLISNEGKVMDLEHSSQVKKFSLDQDNSEKEASGQTSMPLSNDPCLELGFSKDWSMEQSVGNSEVKSVTDGNAGNGDSKGNALETMETLQNKVDILSSTDQNINCSDESGYRGVGDSAENLKLVQTSKPDEAGSLIEQILPATENCDTSDVCGGGTTTTQVSTAVVEFGLADGIEVSDSNRDQEYQKERFPLLTYENEPEDAHVATGVESTKIDRTHSGASSSCDDVQFPDFDDKGGCSREEKDFGKEAASEKDVSLGKINIETDGASGSSFSAEDDRDAGRLTSGSAPLSEQLSQFVGSQIIQVHFSTVPTVFGGQENRHSSASSPSDQNVNSDLARSWGSSKLSDEQSSPGKERILFETNLKGTVSSRGTAILSSPELSQKSVPSRDFCTDASSSDLAPSSESQRTAGQSSDDVGQSQGSLYAVEQERFDKDAADLEGRHPVLLYVQGYVDTLLVLVLDSLARATKDNIRKLWKSSVEKLAKMDLAANDKSLRSPEKLSKTKSLYLHYDSFTQELEGTAVEPVTSKATELVSSSILMHDSFCKMPKCQDIIVRTHTTCSYGHKTLSSETFFQVASTGQNVSFPNPRDPAFSIDQAAVQQLYTDHDAALF